MALHYFCADLISHSIPPPLGLYTFDICWAALAIRNIFTLRLLFHELGLAYVTVVRVFVPSITCKPSERHFMKLGMNSMPLEATPTM